MHWKSSPAAAHHHSAPLHAFLAKVLRHCDSLSLALQGLRYAFGPFLVLEALAARSPLLALALPRRSRDLGFGELQLSAPAKVASYAQEQ
jgi:hypothetical protein